MVPFPAKSYVSASDVELKQRLNWLILGRFLFAVLLLSSTIFLPPSYGSPVIPKPLFMLYLLICCLFLLSLVYYIIIKSIKKNLGHAYCQIVLDTLFVTLIIYLTGGFSSIFSFLYIVVIVYSSILLYRKGSFLIAALSSVQYFILVQLEYLGMLRPLLIKENFTNINYSANQLVFKVLITTSACFAVAFLSSVLSEQAKRSKKELLVMEEHVKRVEKMAYMGEMAANLAHEIKNPLASLAGSIQLLREDISPNKDQDKLMKIILRETDRLGSLVSNFLLFAKTQPGKLENVALDLVLNEAVELFEKDGRFNGRIVIEQDFSPGIWVRVDPMHIRQIILNLLLNAAESIDANGVIKIKMSAVKSNLAEIIIADNGCGIPEEVLSLIFDPFFSTKPRGTGLGLTIVHSLLENYESRLDVESKVGQGTNFSFKLKRIEPPLSANLILTPILN